MGASSATFDFISSEIGATFECSLDGAEFAGCEAPRELTGLSDGSHTFRVRAIDAADNTDPTPASRTWTVDTEGPVMEVTSGPQGPFDSPAVTFEFSSEAGASFECSLDGGTWSACSSPRQYAGLSEAPHAFEVQATDGTGNTGAVASRAFEVDTTAPRVDGVSPGPRSKVVRQDANVTATFSEAMSEASLERPGIVTLRKRGSLTPVVATVDYDPNTGWLVLDPAPPTWRASSSEPRTGPATPPTARGPGASP